MKRMLINATQPEEIRLAMVDGQKLLNFEIEQYGREQRKGNIYKAVVTRIEPSLEACFVDYGEERQGFLPFKEVSRQYFPPDIPVGQAKINEALHIGQELIVQVEKEERGNKNAALTTFISLAGRYLVLMPNKPRSGGVSRRIEGEERQDLKEAMDQLQYPKGMSLIARTAGIGRAVNELQWDLNYLLSLWQAIDAAAQAAPGAFLIYNESALVIRAIRDYYTSDISEILIDTNSFYEQAHKFMELIMPEDARKVKRYRDETALFARFQIEKQIESAYARIVMLPSGGSIVLDHTEALVAIDVNSARATRGGDIEETATNTNLEAADEIARQLRLRDLGGLVVIDFIDMEDSKNRQDVENRLRHALKQDRARIQVSSISKFGLLELSRQRLRPALFEGASITCPRCNGTGHIRDTESSALQILRIIQEEAIKDNTAAIKVQVPVDVTSYLLNKKREEITKIEVGQRVSVVLVPNKQLETPNYNLERIKTDDPQLETLKDTYVAGDSLEDADAVINKAEQKTNRQEPVIKNFLPEAPPPAEQKAKAPEQKTGGFWGWLKNLFSSYSTPSDTKSTEAKKKSSGDRGSRGGNSRSKYNERTDRNNRSGRGRDRDNNESRKNANERDQSANDRTNDRNNERNSDRDRNNERNNDRRNNQRQQNGKDNSLQKRGSRKREETSTDAINPASDTVELSVNTKENDTSRPAREARSNRNNRENKENRRRNNQADNESQSNAVEQAATAPFQEQNANTPIAEQPKREPRERRERRERQPRRQEEQTLPNDAFVQEIQEEKQPSLALSQQGDETLNNTQTAQTIAPVESSDEAARPRARKTRDRYGRDRRQRGTRKEETDSVNTYDVTDGNHVQEIEAPHMPLFANTNQPATALPTQVPSTSVVEEVNVSSSSVDSVGHESAPVRESYNTNGAQYTAETPSQQMEIAIPATATAAQPAVEVTETVPHAPENKFEQIESVTTSKGHDDRQTPYHLPQDQLEHIAHSAGLEWVTTNPEKVAAVQAEIQNQPKPARTPREPRPMVQTELEPLVMVETQRNLSDIPKAYQHEEK